MKRETSDGRGAEMGRDAGGKKNETGFETGPIRDRQIDRKTKE